jgi:hypothetical protein
MNRTIAILGVLLAGQLVLAGALHLGDNAGATPTASSLAHFDRESVDAIELADADDAKLRLERGDNGWQVAQADGFPADGDQVDQLLQQLAALQGQLPVAQSESARSRFGVAASDFERRVALEADGDTVAKLYLGTAAGPGELHARAADSDMIFEVAFALSNAPVEPTPWTDTEVAHVGTEQITRIEMPDFRVTRTDADEAWQLQRDDGGKQTIDRAQARQMLDKLASPGFAAVSRGEAPDGKPSLAYSLHTKDGATIRYRYFGKADADKPARFYRNDQPWAYQAPAQQLAAVEELSPKTLIASENDGAKQASKQPGAPAPADTAASPPKKASAPSS